MKLKLDDQGHAVLADGMPVYTHEDGKDSPFDAPGALQAIKARNAEAKQHRERAETLAGQLKSFEGLDDPDAARKALQTVANLDSKKLVDAGQIEQVKAEISKAYEAKLSTATEQASKLEQQLHGEIVGGSFARSKYIADKLVLPSDLAQAAFGSRFKVEDGKLKAFDADGQPIFSRKNPGAAAEFDEAIEILVDAYPRKDSILRGTQASGSGAPSGNSGGGGGKTITRAQFEQLSASDRMAKMGEGVKVVDSAA